LDVLFDFEIHVEVSVDFEEFCFIEDCVICNTLLSFSAALGMHADELSSWLASSTISE